jgi:hypothetical protein
MLVGTPTHETHETSRVPTILGMMAIVAATGVGAGVLFSQREPPKGAAQAALPAATTTSPAASVALHVSASPAGAQLQIDDVVMPANPWRTTLPRGSTHTVKAIAAGHTSKSEVVTLTAATHVAIALDPVDGPPDEPPGVEAPPPTAAEAPPPTAAEAPPLPPASAPAARRGTPGPARRPAARPPASPPPDATVSATPPSSGAAEVVPGSKVPTRPIDDKNPYE